MNNQAMAGVIFLHNPGANQQSPGKAGRFPE
jgi:hypothetical protein